MFMASNYIIKIMHGLSPCMTLNLLCRGVWIGSLIFIMISLVITIISSISYAKY
jgi:uncharacterized membrane protein YjjP (DUF1212 family)